MAEQSTARKNKINLADYDFRHDIENRLLMAQFTTRDLSVLEMILYSSIRIPIRKLAKDVDLEEEELMPILNRMSRTGLFAIRGDAIEVDKETRKYFESQILKFDPDFRPGMDFVQGLLRKVPIHVLPIWYAIPRTSNNIFESLVEKYLLTPQIFHRYLMELPTIDPLLAGIVDSVYEAPGFELDAKELIEKFQLTREKFEELLLQLEFHFVCCLGYKKVGDEWREVVIPFAEWKEYLMFLHSTRACPIPKNIQIVRKLPSDFSFIHDLSVVLIQARKQPIPLPIPTTVMTQLAAKCEGAPEEPTDYFQKLIGKLRLLKLADIVDGRLYALEAANDWLDLSLESRALFVHRHPLNRLMNSKVSAHLCNDRNIREVEKCITRVLQSGWVYFDDFLKGAIVPLSEDSIVMLKRCGKHWRYSLPSYTEEEKELIRTIILDWLAEVGITAVGTADGRDCFTVTPFGQSLFSK